jgi:putative aldouronate transport system permease protein
MRASHNELPVLSGRRTFAEVLRRDAWLIAFSLPAVVYMVVFNYWPMWGLQIAFKRFSPVLGIWGSPWTGFDNMSRFFNSPYFVRTLTNTLSISFLQVALGFPAPIILALFLNQLTNTRFKKVVQTVTYAPHFISVVVMSGMIILFLSPSIGIANNIIRAFGGEAVFFMTKPKLFPWIFVVTGIWQNAGWGMIIYLAAISSIDPTLYEAAVVDGATRLHRIIHIDLPSLMPTITIVLILRLGRLMDVGWQKAYLLQNQLNLEASELIQTYVYKIGILQGEYHYATAIGLFNSVINLVLILLVNSIAKRMRQETLL